MKNIYFISCLLYIFSSMAHAENAIEVEDAGREAYTHPIANLSGQALESFYRGRSLFNQVWVISPSLDTAVEGLGPLYNQFSCSACHVKDGGGYAPDSANERMRSMLVRLSIAGQGMHGKPRPTAAYGDQLNEQGIPGVPGEGRVRIEWTEHIFHFPDGESLPLRSPAYQFVDLAYGPMQHVMFSPRVAPPVYGTGLLDSIAEPELLKIAGEVKPDGVKGKINQVWDIRLAKTVVGKFGLKANDANLRQQIADAFIGDMGITSSLHNAQNCTAVETECKNSSVHGRLELTDEQLDDIAIYVANLAVPMRRKVNDPQVKTGEQLFTSTECTACHRPALETGLNTHYPALANRTIHPYTDLLLHAMGKDLADGRADFKAAGNEWRTPPLWGIGLAKVVNQRATFLHDGRARSLQEAILWHDGEAKVARDRYIHLAKADREALLAFLDSL